jgi:hypothetical protein
MSTRDDALERSLIELAAAVEFPPDVDLRARVMERIHNEMRPEPLKRQFFLRPLFAYSLATLVALFAAILVFSPTARDAVADLLGVGGVKIEYGGGQTPPIADDLDLGNLVTAEEAGELAGFDLRRPDELGPPPEIYVTDDASTTFVSMVWPATDEISEATSTGVGALLTQFRASIEKDFIKKLTLDDVTITQVTVDGTTGYWVEGPHSVMLLDEVRLPRQDDARLAGNTLLWEKSGITYRLEGDFDRATAVRIGNSMIAD